MEGNEIADDFAKEAESALDVVEWGCIRFAHLTRKTTEARSQRARSSITSHVKSGRRYSRTSAPTYKKNKRSSPADTTSSFPAMPQPEPRSTRTHQASVGGVVVGRGDQATASSSERL